MKKRPSGSPPPLLPLPALRLDRWLWFTRLAPTRALARQLCESGHLRLDGRVIGRSAAMVRLHSVLAFPHQGGVLVVRVEDLPGRRLSPLLARAAYTALPPAPRPQPEVASEPMRQAAH